MAKQTGIIRLEGTLGEINFYFRKGKAVARKAGGGFNRESIKNSPTMERVRENNTEFGDCSKVKKCLKASLHPFLHQYQEGELHGRMMHVLQQIKACDAVSVRGKRNVGAGIGTPEGELLFRKFVFTPKRSVSKTLMGSGTFDWDTFSYTVARFAIKNVRFPRSATHFEVCVGVLNFDFETLDYKLFMGAPLLIGRDFDASTFSLSPRDLPVGSGRQFAFVGLKFYQQVNGVLYLLQDDGAVGLEVVGVSY
jgi:hypothetical protein